MGFPDGSVGKEPACSAGDPGLILGSGRSPGKRNGNSLQYSGHLMQRVDSLEKTHAGRDWGQEEKGMTEDEMAGWHH